jgi:hypothetical protein
MIIVYWPMDLKVSDETIMTWLEEHIDRPNYDITENSYGIVFDNDVDAVAFKLRFGL